jgi:hypothetical protein
MAVTIVMANDGPGIADFHLQWGITQNGNGVGGGQQDFEVADEPFEATYQVGEGRAGTFTVTSSDDPSADFSLSVPVVDCLADPVATIALICPSTPAEGPLIQYTYQNSSQVPVDFTFVDTFGPDIVKSDAKDMVDPSTATRAVYEDHSGHAEAYADGVLLDSLDTSVDCAPPNHIVVSKTVVGGTGNPSFNFEVVCRPDFESPTTVVDSFSLHGGESKSVDLPSSDSAPYCNAREIDPGPAWTVTESFNGYPIDTAFDELFFPNDMDYTLDVTNTAVVESTTTTSTTIPAPVTTTPHPAVTIAGVDAATDPPRQQSSPASAPDQSSSGTLAQTGSDLTTSLLTGLGLLLGGLVVAGATRRSRRRTV